MPMFDSLEGAGRRLIALREELAASETQFEAQYLETKRILEEEIAKMWTGSEEQFRRMRAELPQRAGPKDAG
jgi:hypothetical protein